ncbi:MULTISPECIES: GNAT family N-acetyltransferase [Hyphobacterium]|uniref:GNAT family N-acetyltransferase n=1 Tax=Hyphobacterium vulgare TaxID=1736751 RepID=A0ABV6ZTH6_9PROT
MTEDTFSIPVLETERLILRGHRAEDAPHSYALWAHETTQRYIGSMTSSPGDAWLRMLRYPGLWAILGFGFWAVIEKDCGRFVGECGFADFCRAMTPSIRGLPELGYAITPDAHGKGYATEAVLGAQAWIDRARNRPRCVAIINPHNTASIGVAVKAGYTAWQETEFGGKPVTVYERRP